MPVANTVGFHDLSLMSLQSSVSLNQSDTQFTYTFQNHFHPFVGELIAKLNRDSLRGIFDPTWLAGLKQDFFQNSYIPTGSTIGPTVGAVTVMDTPSSAPRPYVFVRGSDEHLWVNWWDGRRGSGPIMEFPRQRPSPAASVRSP